MILDSDSLRSFDQSGRLSALAAELALVAHWAVRLANLTALASLAGAMGLGVLLLLPLESFAKLSLGLFSGLTLYIIFRSHRGPLFFNVECAPPCDDKRHPQPSDAKVPCAAQSDPLGDLD